MDLYHRDDPWLLFVTSRAYYYSTSSISAHQIIFVVSHEIRNKHISNVQVS